jgi:hypothetical protein
MSDHPSRRKLFSGLFAVGVAWLGLRQDSAVPAPAIPVAPPQPTPPMESANPRSFPDTKVHQGALMTCSYEVFRTQPSNIRETP